MRFIASLMTAALGILIGCLMIFPASAQLIKAEVAGRAPVSDFNNKQNLLYLDLSTGGRVVIWLRPDVAPLMVERIKTLTRKGFYDGLLFHRVIDGFMAQTGDPKGDGTGGSDLPDLKAEFNYLPHVRGAVSAARASSEDSANSQFFIVFQPTLKLDRKYTVFGRVLEGMAYVDAIERGEPPANPSRIVHAYIAADGPPPFNPTPVTPAADLGAPVTLPMKAPSPAPAPAKAKTAAKKTPR
ncbi:MAG: peptidylprolyl isomerase [Sphingomonas sp. 28-62-11]|nr:MAG: peptidylprolyl isomerase [Sphingomonas sp. 28-62-11]